jgi:hypothetical protein
MNYTLPEVLADLAEKEVVILAKCKSPKIQVKGVLSEDKGEFVISSESTSMELGNVVGISIVDGDPSVNVVFSF